MKPWTIAIDGPAGAGKSTLARILAQRLGYLYIDSGAMYRCIALLTLRHKLAPDSDADTIAALARSARLQFVPVDEAGAQQCIFLNDEDVTSVIRSPEVATLASQVSMIPGVRSALVLQQQSMGAGGGVVMEGRDIGTVVFPNAEIKVFLTASPDERATRRHKELASKGHVTTLQEVRADQDARDERDATRAVSPLVTAEDAVVIESDGLTPDEVAEQIVDMLNLAQVSRASL